MMHCYFLISFYYFFTETCCLCLRKILCKNTIHYSKFAHSSKPQLRTTSSAPSEAHPVGTRAPIPLASTRDALLSYRERLRRKLISARPTLGGCRAAIDGVPTTVQWRERGTSSCVDQTSAVRLARCFAGIAPVFGRYFTRTRADSEISTVDQAGNPCRTFGRWKCFGVE